MGAYAGYGGSYKVKKDMNMCFLLLAFNQISNNCGVLHYTSCGQFKISVVIHGPGGVGKQLGAEHSQRLESCFQSIPNEEYASNLEETEMVTYSRMRYHVLQAAKTLVNKGYNPDQDIDIRSLKPFDLHAIRNFVKKTHRVFIVEGCMIRTRGIGASLTESTNANFRNYLDAPIVFLSWQDMPTPYAGVLEE